MNFEKNQFFEFCFETWSEIFFFDIFSKVFIDLNGEQKWCRKLFTLLDYSSNQMKKNSE
jgi:hypothetical protein